MTKENKETNQSWLFQILFSKRVEYWVTLSMLVAVVAFSVVQAKRLSASADRQMESIQRHNSEMAKIRQVYNESHAVESKKWLDGSHEVRMKMLTLESDVRRLKREMHSNELASKMESMSDRDYQALVLENENPSDRKILESHFKQENEFKASLSRTQKRAFDAEVQKAYVKMLADSNGEGALSGLRKHAIR